MHLFLASVGLGAILQTIWAMTCREYLGILILSTSPDVSYIYTILTLQKEPVFRNTLQPFLLSSLFI